MRSRPTSLPDDYVRDNRRSGSTAAPAAWFAYTPNRQGRHPQSHLDNFGGVLQADAFPGYDKIFADGRVREAACMAHARRKVHDLHVRKATGTTTEAMRRIGELYAIEAQIRGELTRAAETNTAAASTASAR